MDSALEAFWVGGERDAKDLGAPKWDLVRGRPERLDGVLLIICAQF